MKPNNSDTFVRWLFHSRCIGVDGACYQRAETIHEINPKSSGKRAAMHWKNRVTLCDHHHKDCHHRGISDELIITLKKRREAVLKFFGNDEYI